MDTYTINVFKEIADIHLTWPITRSHLETTLGLRVIDCGQDLYIIRSGSGEAKSPWFRSVVWDGTTNRPLCVAPPHRRQDIPPDLSACVAETFLEGIMINAFLDSSGNVQIASRSKLGATGTFYSKRPFSDLLKDALGGQSLTLPNGIQFASFLLQHPEHRIVAACPVPALHLIHSGTIHGDGTVRICECRDLERIPLTLTGPLTIAGLQQFVAQIAEQRGYAWQGLVLKDGQGNRWRFRSNSYTMVRALRGDTVRPDVRFLMLREKHLVDTYLYYYPEDKAVLWELEQTLRTMTQRLYDLYVSCHIRHDTLFKELPGHWKTHVYALHSLYLASLKPRGFFVRKHEVVTYMNGLAFQRILHLIKSENTGPSQHLVFETS